MLILPTETTLESMLIDEEDSELTEPEDEEPTPRPMKKGTDTEKDPNDSDEGPFQSPLALTRMRKRRMIIDSADEFEAEEPVAKRKQGRNSMEGNVRLFPVNSCFWITLCFILGRARNSREVTE